MPDLSIVLVEPQGPLNIGSVCRAMANFGFSDLRLVKPQTNHLCYDAHLMAVKAGYLLDEAQVFDSLAEALSDRQYSLATTRRFGRYRDDFLTPDRAAEYLGGLDGQVSMALVFGREDCGLFTEELDLCQRFITIPTCDALASMNLAQSVSLCLYEMSKVFGVDAVLPYNTSDLAANSDIEAMYVHMRGTLTDLDYLDSSNPDHILRSYRRIFGRAGLTKREVKILRGLWHRIDMLISD